MITARELRVGDIVRAGNLENGEISDPAWTTNTKFINQEPDFEAHGYSRFNEPGKQIFQILHIIPAIWAEGVEDHYDMKFMAMSELGMIILWTFEFETFEIISRD